MGLLRIVQSKVSENRYHVTVEVEGDRQARQTAESEFDFELTETDHERIRWYLEDYLQYPHDPAPTIAAGVEKQIEEIGSELFNKVFGSRDAFKLWARIQDKLNDTRVEIATTVEGAAEIPWELMRDPDTGAVLSLRSPAFVRSHS